jgi:hypothetical protein
MCAEAMNEHGARLRPQAISASSIIAPYEPTLTLLPMLTTAFLCLPMMV